MSTFKARLPIFLRVIHASWASIAAEAPNLNFAPEQYQGLRRTWFAHDLRRIGRNLYICRCAYNCRMAHPSKPIDHISLFAVLACLRQAAATASVRKA